MASENLDNLVEGLGAGVIMLDAEGYVLYLNKAALALCDKPHGEIINQPFYQFCGSAIERVKVEYELEQARRFGNYVSEGWRQKNGKRIWAEVQIEFRRDEEPGKSTYSVMISDRTRKKQEEIELRQSEERFRLMVEGVRDYAIFLLDSTGHISTWNEGAKRIKGYSPSEIIGKHFSTFYTLEDKEDGKPERELRIAVATGKYEEEGWRIRKDGSLFWANVVITALFNEQNQLIGFSKVTRDLSEKKESEDRLRLSEERYRVLVEQVSDYGIFMMDDKGRIISWNEGAKRISGYTAEEILGKYFSIFYPEEDILLGKPRTELRVALAEGKYEEEGWRVKKSGEKFWASVVITAVYNRDGTHIGFSKVTRDLTERKAAEHALRESHDRYRQLADALRSTNAELSNANQELEQFTSIVSHDLQEPVRTIRSFLTLLQKKLDAGDVRDVPMYVEKSLTAANRMRELIHNLLQYAQIGRDYLQRERLQFDELANRVIQNLRSTIERTGAVIKIENAVPYVIGDRVQLEQFLQNLIANAIKFNEHSKPEVVIGANNQDGETHLYVRDNGIGIPAHDQTKIFEVFRRLNHGKKYPGTGIGLSICKRIADNHGGRIWVESEPEKGTTFHLSLPDPDMKLQAADK